MEHSEGGESKMEQEIKFFNQVFLDAMKERKLNVFTNQGQEYEGMLNKIQLNKSKDLSLSIKQPQLIKRYTNKKKSNETFVDSTPLHQGVMTIQKIAFFEIKRYLPLYILEPDGNFITKPLLEHVNTLSAPKKPKQIQDANLTNPEQKFARTLKKQEVVNQSQNRYDFDKSSKDVAKTLQNKELNSFKPIMNYDQFKNHTSSFKEELYTTTLDQNKITESQLIESERIAKEILGDTSQINQHVLEERGLKVTYDGQKRNQEQIYSTADFREKKKFRYNKNGLSRQNMGSCLQQPPLPPSKNTYNISPNRASKPRKISMDEFGVDSSQKSELQKEQYQEFRDYKNKAQEVGRAEKTSELREFSQKLSNKSSPQKSGQNSGYRQQESLGQRVCKAKKEQTCGGKKKVEPFLINLQATKTVDRIRRMVVDNFFQSFTTKEPQQNKRQQKKGGEVSGYNWNSQHQLPKLQGQFQKIVGALPPPGFKNPFPKKPFQPQQQQQQQQPLQQQPQQYQYQQFQMQFNKFEYPQQQYQQFPNKFNSNPDNNIPMPILPPPQYFSQQPIGSQGFSYNHLQPIHQLPPLPFNTQSTVDLNQAMKAPQFKPNQNTVRQDN